MVPESKIEESRLMLNAAVLSTDGSLAALEVALEAVDTPKQFLLVPWVQVASVLQLEVSEVASVAASMVAVVVADSEVEIVAMEVEAVVEEAMVAAAAVLATKAVEVASEAEAAEVGMVAVPMATLLLPTHQQVQAVVVAEASALVGMAAAGEATAEIVLLQWASPHHPEVGMIRVASAHMMTDPVATVVEIAIAAEIVVPAAAMAIAV